MKARPNRKNRGDEGREDKGEGLEPTHVTLLGLTLPLPKGEASQARMQPNFTYRSAN
jgi:hypothetical protein